MRSKDGGCVQSMNRISLPMFDWNLQSISIEIQGFIKDNYKSKIRRMSEQSSFREMFEFPNDGLVNKQRKYMLKGHRNKRTIQETQRPQLQSFYGVVQKAKNVALFTQNLKQRIAQNRGLNNCNLNANELQHLENDSLYQAKLAYFSHDNKVILSIEVTYIITMLLYLWQCTFQIVFGEMETNSIINGLTLLFYIIHILLFQFTEYQNEKSELITDVNLIRHIYYDQRLLKDSISVLVILLQLTPLDNYHSMTPIFMILRVLSLLSYFELSSTCEKVKNLFVSSTQSQTINSLLKLAFKLFLFLHMLSMALNLMANIEQSFNIHNNWLNNQNLVYDTSLQRYVIGWYWGSTILSTVGFGQIIPANNIERFVISIVEVCCCMTFGYFVNAIGEIIKLRSQASQKYEKEIRRLNRYLNETVISNDLKHKIRTHYFNKHLIEQTYDPNQGKQVLNTITPNLKNSLLQEVNVKIIKKCTPLDKFRDQTIKYLAESINRILFAPEAMLYSRNTTEKKIWFIQSGTVQQLTQNFPNSILRKVVSIFDEKNPLVGWTNFLTPGGYKIMGRAKKFTVAHEICESKFVECLQYNNIEYHKFLQMKQRMIEKRRQFQPKCVSCGRYTHNVINCPRIHLVKKDGYKIAMQRKEIDRYRLQQEKNKKQRSNFRCNWKLLFGTKQLESEAKLLNKNESIEIPQGTIENYLKRLGNRVSLTNYDRRKASVCLIIPRELKAEEQDGKLLAKNAQNGDRSMISFDSEEQQRGLQFEKAFFNKELKSYMPENDIEQVLADYSKKIMKKKMKGSKRDLLMPSKL